ncbi:MAG TPA: shikimate dehydrogenase [Anaerolineales bacterium]|nr:shikimate dehydrogenase [Anaerolineales bacterium]
MIKLGLIGYPLGHSLSPRIHDAALQACGLEGEYDPFPIRLDDTQELNNLLSCVRTGEITGLNVTIPHKQNVMQFLDELTPTAQAIGAVNTIHRRDNKLIGDNTDAPGFLSDLHRFLGEKPSSSAHRPLSLVLGAGGAARAIVYALVQDGWDVSIAARRLEQADELAGQFEHISTVEWGVQTFQAPNIELIVNTTPVGMTPNIDQSPLPENIVLPKQAAIYDLIYNPHETKLVRDARAQGLQATTGLGMLIDQAALAFEIWTGYSPSREMMRSAIDNL